MECSERDINTSKLVCWGRLSESPLFNPDYKQARETRERFQQCLSSVSHSNRRFKPTGRPTAVQTNFLLAPILKVTGPRRKSSAPAYDATPSVHRTETEVNVIDVLHKRHWAAVQKNKIGFMSLLLKLGRSPSPSIESLTSLTKEDINDVNDTSSEGSWFSTPRDTPLPVFPTRERTKLPLLRRPTISKADPLPINDEYSVELSKHIDLKALPFKKTGEAFKFYDTHYPLILTKTMYDGERCGTPSKRVRTPESPVSLMIHRQRKLNKRLIELEAMMETLENQTEDCEFMTELHSDTFNPTKWKWNTVDVVGLRRRYTIDASLSEMP